MRHSNVGSASRRSRRPELNPYVVEVLALTPEELERARTTQVVFPACRSIEPLV